MAEHDRSANTQPTQPHADAHGKRRPCGVVKPEAGEQIGPGAQAVGIDQDLKAANLKHLRRIEGQVRGIAAMIEEDRYCADIIQQCAAVQESLRSVAKNLLRNHLSHCANQAMHGNKAQQAAMVEELIALVGKIAR